jgi:hypothetical protein
MQGDTSTLRRTRGRVTILEESLSEARGRHEYEGS